MMNTMLTTKEHIINRKIIILKSRKPQKKIVARLGMTRQAFYMTITGARTCEKTQKAICKIFKVSKEEFWPEFYPNGDDPISHDARINDQAGAVN